MFKSLRNGEGAKINHSGRSHVGETMQLEGDIRTSGSIDIAGLINGNVFVSEVTITETGSIRGSLEASTVEINGHIEGKIIADAETPKKTTTNVIRKSAPKNKGEKPKKIITDVKKKSVISKKKW